MPQVSAYHACMLLRRASIAVTELDDVPTDAVVLASTIPGAAMLEGWADDGRWRWLLPWPDETRELAWKDAAQWKRLFAELEASVEAGEERRTDAPFLGGWVGFIAYEAAATEEAIVARSADPPEPPMFFARHSAGVLIDPAGRAFLFAPEDDLDRRRSDLKIASPKRNTGAPRSAAIVDSLAEGAHARAVERIRSAIRDGDVYQVNLTRAFSVDAACDPGSLYRALTGSQPPRSSAFLRTGSCAIASASPEVLMRFDRVEERAETRPIKGTIRRSGHDDEEISALLASEKDAAEHMMIVDVSRNDLGKIAAIGSVEVSEYRAVRTLEHVHHLESTVRAETPGSSAADVLAALSPAASITGAPKRAAVEIIRELEPAARGVYCGSIGFIGHRHVEMSVAIRTAVVTDDSVRYHAGGGIVWDSDAAAEDDESFAKAAAFLAYVGAAR
jgi:para-aminobenzoate synthetase component 1